MLYSSTLLREVLHYFQVRDKEFFKYEKEGAGEMSQRADVLLYMYNPK